MKNMGFKLKSITLLLSFIIGLPAWAHEPFVEKYLQEVTTEALRDLEFIKVGGKTLSQTQKTDNLPDVSAWILENIRTCPSPCHLSFGPYVYTIQTPALGEGERGIVFRLLENNRSYVVKIAKPELKSLAILRAETQSHSFWSKNQTSSFSVPARVATHPSGLFSVMQEIKGEPLTNALFRLGLLQMDPVGGDVMVNPSTNHVQSAELEKIWSTVADLIEIVKKNPQMKTSLSPNNIFVSWSADGRIDKLSLIDFGIDGTGDSRYFELKNLNEYLKLSAIKIKGYLAKPGFVSPDLFDIQKKAQAQYKLPSFFDEAAYRPLLEEVAQKILPPGRDVTKLTLAQILDLPIPAKWSIKMKIGNVSFMPAKTVGDLTHTAVSLNHMLSKQDKGVVAVEIDGRTHKIKIPALGQGDRGIVYALEGTEEVIKIPKGNLASVLTLMNESIGYNFWYEASLKSKGVFSVPERSSLHPLGLYSLMKRDHGEPLTKMMVRYGLLSFDPATGKAQTHPENISAMSAANRAKVESGLLGILKIIREQPKYGLSVSPNNLHVNYADAEKTIISDVVLIDVGLGNRNASKFDSIVDLESYVELSRNRLEKYIKVGYVDAELATLNRGSQSGAGAFRCSAVFAP